MRVGHGFDAHAFGDGRTLMLGGVAVPHPRGLAGHSDGDVVIHAVIDALLGAAGLGDIGGMFPSWDDRWKAAAGGDLLGQASKRIRKAGYGIVNVDATIVAQSPRVAGYIEGMRAAMAAALEIDIKQVNVKATTTDGMGFTGRGEGIAAFASVLLQ